MMKIEICGTSARCIQPMLLTSGLVGAQVEFGFDEAWEDLGRCAVFTDGVVTKDAILGEGNRCAIPHEVLAAVGRELRVGVYGANADGDVVIPTVYVKCGTICPGTDPAGDESYPPAPDVTKQLLARMEEMEQTIGGAVNGVQSVNGETGAVVLSAEDVGALPADTKIPEIPAKISAFENDRGYLTEHQDLSGYAKKADIPSVPTKVSTFTNDAGYVTASAIPAVPAKLSNPYKLTFSGAVSAEYDGSSAVEVVIPQGGGGGGGGGSGDEVELLADFTTEEATSIITVSEDMDGNPFVLKKVIFALFAKSGTDGTLYVYPRIGKGQFSGSCHMGDGAVTTNRRLFGQVERYNNGRIGYIITQNPGTLGEAATLNGDLVHFPWNISDYEYNKGFVDPITEFDFFTYGSIAAGARVVVYGVRA